LKICVLLVTTSGQGIYSFSCNYFEKNIYGSEKSDPIAANSRGNLLFPQLPISVAGITTSLRFYSLCRGSRDSQKGRGMDENVESSEPKKHKQTKAFGADEPVNDPLQQTHGTDLTKIFKQVKVRETAQSPSTPPASNDSRDATEFFSPVTSRRASEGEVSTQTFQSLETNTASSTAEPVPPVRDTQHHHHSSSQPADASSPAIAGSREFTRLFKRPDDQKSRTADSTQRDFYGKPAPPRQVGGGFTQLLRTLSSEDNDELPIYAPVPLAQPLPDGPGEFTRIASRSALRGGAGRERGQQANEPPDRYAHAQAALVDPQRFIANAQPLPSVAGIGMPASPPVGQAASVATPLSAPAIASPAPQSQPQLQSGGNLQRNIPLLLISNLFALFLLMMLLFLVLLRHR
jgi:hypothetical protein